MGKAVLKVDPARLARRPEVSLALQKRYGFPAKSSHSWDCCHCCTTECSCVSCSSVIAAFVSNQTDTTRSCWDLTTYQSIGYLGSTTKTPEACDRFWRICEVGSSGTACCCGVNGYTSGSVDEDGTLVGLPDDLCSEFAYDGFLQLQCYCTQPPVTTKSWNCVDYECVRVDDSSGTYATLEECEAACAYIPVPGCCVFLGSSGEFEAPCDGQIYFLFNDEIYDDNTDPTEGWTITFDGTPYTVSHMRPGTPGPVLTEGVTYSWTASGTLTYLTGSGFTWTPDGGASHGGPLSGFLCPDCPAYSLVGIIEDCECYSYDCIYGACVSVPGLCAGAYSSLEECQEFCELQTCCIQLGVRGTFTAPCSGEMLLWQNDEDYADNTADIITVTFIHITGTETYTVPGDSNVSWALGGVPGPTLVDGEVYRYYATGWWRIGEAFTQYHDADGQCIWDCAPPYEQMTAGGETYICPEKIRYSLIGTMDCACEETWNCESGTCVSVSGTTGTYATYAECVLACGDECTGWYCCEDSQEVAFIGNCQEFEEAEAACTGLGWSCEGPEEGCNAVKGGEFASLTECEEECLDWLCENTFCNQEVGGTYETQAECLETCECDGRTEIPTITDFVFTPNPVTVPGTCCVTGIKVSGGVPPYEFEIDWEGTSSYTTFSYGDLPFCFSYTSVVTPGFLKVTDFCENTSSVDSEITVVGDDDMGYDCGDCTATVKGGTYETQEECEIACECETITSLVIDSIAYTPGPTVYVGDTVSITGISITGGVPPYTFSVDWSGGGGFTDFGNYPADLPITHYFPTYVSAPGPLRITDACGNYDDYEAMFPMMEP